MVRNGQLNQKKLFDNYLFLDEIAEMFIDFAKPQNFSFLQEG